MRGAGRFGQQVYDFIATVPMMADGLGDPGAMSGKRVAVGGQDEIDIERGQPLERFQKLGQHIAAGMPGDIGSDIFQNLVAGEEQLSFARVEANMSGRMAGRPDHFERAESGLQFFAAGEQLGGSERVEVLAHLGEMLFHSGFERRWNAGLKVGLLEPGYAAIAVGD